MQGRRPRLERTSAAGMTVSGFALVAVCYGLARFAYGLFAPAFRAEFGLSNTLLGTVAAGSYVGYCAAVLTSAAGVARFGSRAVAIAAGVIAASGMATIAGSPNAWILAFGVLLAGTSTGGASPPLAEAVARHVPPHRHDRVQAIVNAGTGAGVAVSGVVALLALDSWRAAWGLFVLIAVFVTISVARYVPASPEAEVTGASAHRGLGAVIGAKRSWRLAVAAALLGATSSAVWTFGRDHVTQTNGMGQTGSMALWIVLGVAELAALGTGDLIVRWGLRVMWRLSLTLLAVATAVLGVYSASSVGVFLAIAVFGASYIALTTVVFLWGTRLHPDHTAPSLAFGFLAIAAGQALASPLVGAIVDHAGSSTAFLLCAGTGAATAHLLAPTQLTHDTHPDRERGHCAGARAVAESCGNIGTCAAPAVPGSAPTRSSSATTMVCSPTD